MVQALPQYSEQIDKLSLHVDVSLLYIEVFFLLKMNSFFIFYLF